MLFTYAKGATPLSPDEVYNLIPSHLMTQKELDEWEQYNIIKAETWASQRKRADFLSTKFVVDLHKKMFNETWKWAGKFRTRQTNIGIEAIHIPVELKLLFDDIEFWIENATYHPREIAVRLHHRLVFIHPFPNGNGRLSRLVADLYMDYQGQARFSWGSCNLTSDSAVRQAYLSALREADLGDYMHLIEFSDS
ncbi:MAG: mobile mystery protein B [Rickettsiales bacterium]|nr:MAG: mobile mystery protein B [Rickettsiales bacterium]